MNVRFDAKVVVVSGAAGGLGRRFVEDFLAAGARVFCCDRNAAGLDVVAAAGAETAVVDLTDRAAAQAWIANVEDGAGRAVDVLVNNAGGAGPAARHLIEDVPDAEWDTLMAINPGIAFTLTKAVVPAMKRTGNGRIVNISSGAGIAASRALIHPYTAAKHAVVGLTRQTAEELGQFGITVNSVAPGFVISGPRLQTYWDAESPDAQRAHLATTFMRRVGRPEDVSNAVLFLASEYASFITGQVISVNGGIR